MYTSEEISTLYSFLKQTSEGNLRKMLVQGRLSETHFSLLMKTVRHCPEAEFVTHFQNGTFPKIKLNAGEIAVKEHVWSISVGGFISMGLLQKQSAAA